MFAGQACVKVESCIDAHVLDWTVVVKGINQIVSQQVFASAKC